jgi:hypothetical protein
MQQRPGHHCMRRPAGLGRGVANGRPNPTCPQPETPLKFFLQLRCAGLPSLKPIGYTWSYFTCRIGIWSSIWQPSIGCSCQYDAVMHHHDTRPKTMPLSAEKTSPFVMCEPTPSMTPESEHWVWGAFCLTPPPKKKYVWNQCPQHTNTNICSVAYPSTHSPKLPINPYSHPQHFPSKIVPPPNTHTHTHNPPF